MEINLKQIKKKINDLKSLIDEYEEIFLNLYKELENMEFYWRDNYSEIFIKDVREKKQKIKINLEELQEVVMIYQYILESYSKLGEIITATTNNKEKVVTKYDNYINKINNILTLYNQLDLNSFPNESQIILLQKEKLVKNKQKVIQLKQQTQQLLLDIEKIEEEVKMKISKIDFEIIQDTIQKDIQINTRNFTKHSYNMDTNQIEIYSNKIEMYNREEQLNIEKIIKELIEINTYYRTKNTLFLNNIKFDIEKSLKSICHIHENYITIINSKKNSYKETSKKTSELFKEIKQQ